MAEAVAELRARVRARPNKALHLTARSLRSCVGSGFRQQVSLGVGRHRRVSDMPKYREAA